MELLAPSHEFPYKEDSFENSPSTIPITVDNTSPLEIPRQLSPTSIPHPPSDLTILPQMLHFQHSLEDQFLHSLMLEDQADLLSSTMTIQLLHLQMHHRQHRPQENEKVRLFVDHNQQAVMCDA